MIEKMLETLELEACVLNDQMIENANKEGSKIIDESEQEAKKLAQVHIGKMDLALKSESARIQITAELERKRKIIQVKEEFAAKVYAKTESDLRNLRNNKEEYKKTLKNLLLESLNQVSGKKVQVEVDKSDKDLLSGIMSELNLKHDVSLRNDSLGGLSLFVDGNRILVYNTMESRLNKSKQVLKSQLNEVLFGDRQTAVSIR